MNRQGGSILLLLIGALLLAAPLVIQEVRLGENRRVLQEWNSRVALPAGARAPEPVEALRAESRSIQRGLDLARAPETPASPPPIAVATPAPTIPTTLAAPSSPTGETQSQATAAGFRILLPSLDLDWAVMADIGNAELAAGPGHYPGTALPGAGGNLAIAGHRTHRGRPSYFYQLNRLAPGDAVIIQQGEHVWHYQVERSFITDAYDRSVLDSTAEPTLTLTTCDPPGTEDLRLIVKARLVPTT